jgi:hypothetical protein
MPYQPTRRKAQMQGRRVTTRSLPSPVGGLNTRDSVDVMEPQYAVVLDNWWPDGGRVHVRKGFDGHATGVGSGDVETIAEFNSAGTRKMLAAGGGSIYDATSGGAATSKASGFSENRWAWANFNGSMGLVNGTDAPQTYDGSTVGAMTVSGSGLTVADLTGVFVHQSRTYFWETDSQDFWYSSTNALGGTLTKFQLSRVGQFGGDLVCAGSWNIDGGSDTWGGGGIANQLAVFVMSSGQTIVYQGDDPGSQWDLVGVYKIGEPISRDAIMEIAGDLIIATNAGYVSMTRTVRDKEMMRDRQLSSAIGPSVRDDASDYGTNSGWQLIHYPGATMVLGNVPVSSTAFRQYAMNTETESWCRFLDIESRVWGVFNGDLYFGDGAGNVRKFWAGYDDNGTAIDADAQTAFSYFGDRGSVKRCAGLRPVIHGSGSATGGIVPQFDFGTSSVAVTEITISTTDNWEDIDINWETWDTPWGDGTNVPGSFWTSAEGVGYAVGARFRVASSDSFRWSTTTFNLEPGDGLA